MEIHTSKENNILLAPNLLLYDRAWLYSQLTVFVSFVPRGISSMHHYTNPAGGKEIHASNITWNKLSLYRKVLLALILRSKS